MTSPDAHAVSERFANAVQERDEARRQAIIEHRRTMKDQREFIAANRHRLHEIWEDVPCPPLTIAEHIAEGKANPERWAQLQAEWIGEDECRKVFGRRGL
jgi:hypothetical protein